MCMEEPLFSEFKMTQNPNIHPPFAEHKSFPVSENLHWLHIFEALLYGLDHSFANANIHLNTVLKQDHTIPILLSPNVSAQNNHTPKSNFFSSLQNLPFSTANTTPNPSKKKRKLFCISESDSESEHRTTNTEIQHNLHFQINQVPDQQHQNQRPTFLKPNGITNSITETLSSITRNNIFNLQVPESPKSHCKHIFLLEKVSFFAESLKPLVSRFTCSPFKEEIELLGLEHLSIKSPNDAYTVNQSSLLNFSSSNTTSFPVPASQGSKLCSFSQHANSFDFNSPNYTALLSIYEATKHLLDSTFFMYNSCIHNASALDKYKFTFVDLNLYVVETVQNASVIASFFSFLEFFKTTRVLPILPFFNTKSSLLLPIYTLSNTVIQWISTNAPPSPSNHLAANLVNSSGTPADSKNDSQSGDTFLDSKFPQTQKRIPQSFTPKSYPTFDSLETLDTFHQAVSTFTDSVVECCFIYVNILARNFPFKRDTSTTSSSKNSASASFVHLQNIRSGDTTPNFGTPNTSTTSAISATSATSVYQNSVIAAATQSTLVNNGFNRYNGYSGNSQQLVLFLMFLKSYLDLLSQLNSSLSLQFKSTDFQDILQQDANFNFNTYNDNKWLGSTPIEPYSSPIPNQMFVDKYKYNCRPEKPGFPKGTVFGAVGGYQTRFYPSCRVMASRYDHFISFSRFSV
ncbi:hypothetical protein BB560_001181 [Smittium megazygosporum]|uniref:Uncharacterized protein n=1 Tax=Smittium megazygosporum TaxID=133381 RepID=A0A2T9ZIB2_9FUNG|nr:hypothetical protein BB560_001181 [Smittium megazygosporum]